MAKPILETATTTSQAVSNDRLSGRPFAVVAVNKPSASGFSIRNILGALRALDFATMIVSTSPLSEAERSELTELADILVERLPFGRDFGSYQFAIKWLQQAGLYQSVPELVLCNDSVFWPKAAQKELALLYSQPASWKCLFEHVAVGPARYHAQSFFLGFDRNILDSDAFKSFWESYVPWSHRVHAIHEGEEGLSATLVRAGFAPRVLYDMLRINSALEASATPGESDDKLRKILAHYLFTDPFSQMENLNLLAGPVAPKSTKASAATLLASLPASIDGRDGSSAADFKEVRLMRSISRRMSEANPSHAAGLLCNHLFGAPIKRDICHTYGEAIGTVLSLASGFDDAELAQIQRTLVNKGPKSQYTGYEKYLLDKGWL